MGGTGLFYYKNKEDIASTVSKKETVKDRNSISSKKETVNEKNSAVEEYEMERIILLALIIMDTFIIKKDMFYIEGI